MQGGNRSVDYSEKWFAFIGIALLSFGCYLDYTVVNVALPTIQQDLNANLLSLQWIMNIYFLTLCVCATVMGRLGDLYGRRRIFYLGCGIFLIASIFAGLAFNIELLIFGRFLQGIGAAIVFPLGPSLLPQSFPEKDRGKAIAWLGSIGGLALALGPIIGGFIVTYLTWRWIFFINVPITILGYVFCFNSVKEMQTIPQKIVLDIKGMILLALAMGGIVLSLISSQKVGWGDIKTLTYLLIGLIATPFLIIVEKKQKDALIDFNDFSNLLFFGGAILCFLAGVLSAVCLFLDPLYLEIIKNLTPQISGFILFAIPVAVFVVAFFVGVLIFRLGIINTILIGLALAFISPFMQTFFSDTTSLWYIVFAFFILGSMWTLGNTVSIIAAQKAVEDERKSVATGTIVTMFNIGGSMGLSLAMVIYHALTSNALNKIYYSHVLPTNSEQFLKLKKLISNPAHALQTTMFDNIEPIFNRIFLHGFIGVMWFLFILSFVAFVIILIWKMLGRKKVFY